MFLPFQARFDKIVTNAIYQMAADKEAVVLSRIYVYEYMRILPSRDKMT